MAKRRGQARKPAAPDAATTPTSAGGCCMDESHTIRRGNDELAVLGVQNWSSHANFPKHGNLPQAHAASGDAPFKLLLSHDPSHWEAQVARLPRHRPHAQRPHPRHAVWGEPAAFQVEPGAIFLSSSGRASTSRARQRLYVNVGLGYLGFPGRVGFLPEITLLELRRA
ncbi:MAG: hypothetical protein WKG07_30955 [Hymenobacter sp.]